MTSTLRAVYNPSEIDAASTVSGSISSVTYVDLLTPSSIDKHIVSSLRNKIDPSKHSVNKLVNGWNFPLKCRLDAFSSAIFREASLCFVPGSPI